MPSGCYRTSNENVGANPQLAIDFVKGVAHGDRLKVNLSDALYYYGKNESMIAVPNDDERAFAWPNLCDRGRWGSRVALLMNGTTDELKRTLHLAKIDGLEGFEASNDRIVVWYLRRRAGDETKSLVLIAPRSSFLGASLDDPVKNYKYKTKNDGWQFMAASNHDSGISLQYLITEVLPKGEGVTAWW